MTFPNQPETFAEGRFLRLVRRRHWEWAERTNASSAAIIVAVTADRRVLFVEQHRIPLDASTIELPAGLVGDQAGDEHEDPAIAAQRELFEETGYEAASLEFLAECPTSPGLTDESVRFYLARDARQVGPGGGDAREQITVHATPLEECDDWLRGMVAQGKRVSATVYAGLRLMASGKGGA
jgi:ADP-ribose pyrophosphatase